MSYTNLPLPDQRAFDGRSVKAHNLANMQEKLPELTRMLLQVIYSEFVAIVQQYGVPHSDGRADAAREIFNSCVSQSKTAQMLHVLAKFDTSQTELHPDYLMLITEFFSNHSMQNNNVPSTPMPDAFSRGKPTSKKQAFDGINLLVTAGNIYDEEENKKFDAYINYFVQIMNI